jgi:hypothetical protein
MIHYTHLAQGPLIECPFGSVRFYWQESDVPIGWASLQQVHGSTLIEVEPEGSPLESSPPQADGWVTRHPNLELGIRTADCLSVAFLGIERGCLLHAGWRGLRLGMIEKALTAMAFDRLMVVVLGPCISAPFYEVDEAFVAQWHPFPQGFAQHLTPTDRKGFFLFDLKGYARTRLNLHGILNTQIVDVPLCTFRDGLPSYRRDQQQAARLVTVMNWKGALEGLKGFGESQ